MEFSRQGYWSRLPFPAPGDLLNPVTEPTSLAFPALAGGFFNTEPPEKPPPTGMATIKRKKKLSLGKNVEKLELPDIAGENVKWSSIWKTV